MSQLFDALRASAAFRPAQIAIRDCETTITYGELLPTIERLAGEFSALAPGGVALLADNGCSWVLADLALHAAGIPCLPLPLFFSAAQIAHTLASSGIRHVLTDQAERLAGIASGRSLATAPALQGLRLVALDGPDSTASKLPPGSTKITFTSGTTGEPKGVCLDGAALEAVATALLDASQGTPGDRHLCLLPLSTLLENIAGIYTPLLAGAQICVPPLAQVGLTGSSGLDVAQMANALSRWGATTAITVPQTLLALVAAASNGIAMSPTLRYVAVGGAPVTVRLLELARRAGVPAYEGYGLSECGSVVAVNRMEEARPGSVGKPLPHVRIEFAHDGEILVHGARWHGYLGATPPAPGEATATGDLGHLDADGYLHVTGRKKNNFITSFGRNVAPEWIEGELVTHAPILQAVVFGEGRPVNVAVLFAPRAKHREDIESAVRSANAILPDYARVAHWVLADEPFSPANALLTHNGRPRRDRIHDAYAAQIDALYQLHDPIERLS